MDDDLRTYGWAPGHYMQSCRRCGIRHVADKHAWHCSDCAKAALNDNKGIIVEQHDQVVTISRSELAALYADQRVLNALREAGVDDWHQVVTISPGELAKLQDDRRVLNSLRDAGVDDWEGYSYAMDLLGGE